MKTGYKAFDENLQCRGMQFKVGKTYKISEKVSVCAVGFHYCETLFDVYNYYPKSEKTRICEIEDHGDTVKEGDKSATNKIKIIRELTEKELLCAWIKRTNSGDYNSGSYNSGSSNSGYRNSGSYNSGSYNSGSYNSGSSNSGSSNSGSSNSGSYNSGSSNSGDYNSGYRNSGSSNSGSYNSGDYNSGYYNSGYFNTNSPKVRLFNQSSDIEFDSETINKLNSLQYKVKPILQWVYSDSMTDDEKENFPSHKTTGGFLRKTDRNDFSAWKEDLEFFKSLPNFDASIFEEITGIKV